MEDPEGNNGSENGEVNAEEEKQQPQDQPAEGQPDIFQDEDDYLTADHVFFVGLL